MIFKSSSLVLGIVLLSVAPSTAGHDIYVSCSYTECKRLKIPNQVDARIYYIRSQCENEYGEPVPKALHCSTPMIEVVCPGDSYVEGDYRVCRCNNPTLSGLFNFFVSLSCSK